MRDQKTKENEHIYHRHHREYYDNYISNVQEVFNKNFDKPKGILVTGKHHTKNFSSNLMNAKQKKETVSCIHNKLGNKNLIL